MDVMSVRSMVASLFLIVDDWSCHSTLVWPLWKFEQALSSDLAFS